MIQIGCNPFVGKLPVLLKEKIQWYNVRRPGLRNWMSQMLDALTGHELLEESLMKRIVQNSSLVSTEKVSPLPCSISVAGVKLLNLPRETGTVPLSRVWKWVDGYLKWFDHIYQRHFNVELWSISMNVVVSYAIHLDRNFHRIMMDASIAQHQIQEQVIVRWSQCRYIFMMSQQEVEVKPPLCEKGEEEKKLLSLVNHVLEVYWFSLKICFMKVRFWKRVWSTPCGRRRCTGCSLPTTKLSTVLDVTQDVQFGLGKSVQCLIDYAAASCVN